jgi:hypothetical protein
MPCEACTSPADAWAIVEDLLTEALEGDVDCIELLPYAIEHALAAELAFAA